MEKSSKPRSTMARRAVAVAMAGASLLVFAGPSMGASATVKAADRTFSPGSKSVSKGTKVVWKNADDERHNVTAYKGSWSKNSDLPEGGKTSFTFRKKGTYKYRCTLHSKLDDGECEGMCGSVSVR